MKYYTLTTGSCGRHEAKLLVAERIVKERGDRAYLVTNRFKFGRGSGARPSRLWESGVASACVCGYCVHISEGGGRGNDPLTICKTVSAVGQEGG